jgi:hypothetical protein
MLPTVTGTLPAFTYVDKIGDGVIRGRPVADTRARSGLTLTLVFLRLSTAWGKVFFMARRMISLFRHHGIAGTASM